MAGPEGYIHKRVSRVNKSVKWVNEWGVNYGQVGSRHAPVANRLSHIAHLGGQSESCCVLAVASARKGNIWLVMAA